MVSIAFQDANGSEWQEMFPEGDGCANCKEGIGRGASYLDWDGVCNLSDKSPDFKAVALGCAEANRARRALA